MQLVEAVEAKHYVNMVYGIVALALSLLGIYKICFLLKQHMCAIINDAPVLRC